MRKTDKKQLPCQQEDHCERCKRDENDLPSNDYKDVERAICEPSQNLAETYSNAEIKEEINKRPESNTLDTDKNEECHEQCKPCNKTNPIRRSSSKRDFHSGGPCFNMGSNDDHCEDKHRSQHHRYESEEKEKKQPCPEKNEDFQFLDPCNLDISSPCIGNSYNNAMSTKAKNYRGSCPESRSSGMVLGNVTQTVDDVNDQGRPIPKKRVKRNCIKETRIGLAKTKSGVNLTKAVPEVATFGISKAEDCDTIKSSDNGKSVEEKQKNDRVCETISCKNPYDAHNKEDMPLDKDASKHKIMINPSGSPLEYIGDQKAKTFLDTVEQCDVEFIPGYYEHSEEFKKAQLPFNNDVRGIGNPILNPSKPEASVSGQERSFLRVKAGNISEDTITQGGTSMIPESGDADSCNLKRMSGKEDSKFPEISKSNRLASAFSNILSGESTQCQKHETLVSTDAFKSSPYNTLQPAKTRSPLFFFVPFKPDKNRTNLQEDKKENGGPSISHNKEQRARTKIKAGPIKRQLTISTGRQKTDEIVTPGNKNRTGHTVSVSHSPCSKPTKTAELEMKNNELQLKEHKMLRREATFELVLPVIGDEVNFIHTSNSAKRAPVDWAGVSDAGTSQILMPRARKDAIWSVPVLPGANQIRERGNFQIELAVGFEEEQASLINNLEQLGDLGRVSKLKTVFDKGKETEGKLEKISSKRVYENKVIMQSALQIDKGRELNACNEECLKNDKHDSVQRTKDLEVKKKDNSYTADSEERGEIYTSKAPSIYKRNAHKDIECADGLSPRCCLAGSSIRPLIESLQHTKYLRGLFNSQYESCPDFSPIGFEDHRMEETTGEDQQTKNCVKVEATKMKGETTEKQIPCDERQTKENRCLGKKDCSPEREKQFSTFKPCKDPPVVSAPYESVDCGRQKLDPNIFWPCRDPLKNKDYDSEEKSEEAINKERRGSPQSGRKDSPRSFKVYSDVGTTDKSKCIRDYDSISPCPDNSEKGEHRQSPALNKEGNCKTKVDKKYVIAENSKTCPKQTENVSPRQDLSLDDMCLAAAKFINSLSPAPDSQGTSSAISRSSFKNRPGLSVSIEDTRRVTIEQHVPEENISSCLTQTQNFAYPARIKTTETKVSKGSSPRALHIIASDQSEIRSTGKDKEAPKSLTRPCRKQRKSHNSTHKQLKTSCTESLQESLSDKNLKNVQKKRPPNYENCSLFFQTASGGSRSSSNVDLRKIKSFKKQNIEANSKSESHNKSRIASPQKWLSQPKSQTSNSKSGRLKNASEARDIKTNRHTQQDLSSLTSLETVSSCCTDQDCSWTCEEDQVPCPCVQCGSPPPPDHLVDADEDADPSYGYTHESLLLTSSSSQLSPSVADLSEEICLSDSLTHRSAGPRRSTTSCCSDNELKCLNQCESSNKCPVTCCCSQCIELYVKNRPKKGRAPTNQPTYKDRPQRSRETKKQEEEGDGLRKASKNQKVAPKQEYDSQQQKMGEKERRDRDFIHISARKIRTKCCQRRKNQPFLKQKCYETDTSDDSSGAPDAKANCICLCGCNCADRLHSNQRKLIQCRRAKKTRKYFGREPSIARRHRNILGCGCKARKRDERYSCSFTRHARCFNPHPCGAYCRGVCCDNRPDSYASEMRRKNEPNSHSSSESSKSCRCSPSEMHFARINDRRSRCKYTVKRCNSSSSQEERLQKIMKLCSGILSIYINTCDNVQKRELENEKVKETTTQSKDKTFPKELDKDYAEIKKQKRHRKNLETSKHRSKSPKLSSAHSSKLKKCKYKSPTFLKSDVSSDLGHKEKLSRARKRRRSRSLSSSSSSSTSGTSSSRGKGKKRPSRKKKRRKSSRSARSTSKSSSSRSGISSSNTVSSSTSSCRSAKGSVASSPSKSQRKRNIKRRKRGRKKLKGTATQTVIDNITENKRKISSALSTQTKRLLQLEQSIDHDIMEKVCFPGIYSGEQTPEPPSFDKCERVDVNSEHFLTRDFRDGRSSLPQAYAPQTSYSLCWPGKRNSFQTRRHYGSSTLMTSKADSLLQARESIRLSSPAVYTRRHHKSFTYPRFSYTIRGCSNYDGRGRSPRRSKRKVCYCSCRDRSITPDARFSRPASNKSLTGSRKSSFQDRLKNRTSKEKASRELSPPTPGNRKSQQDNETGRISKRPSALSKQLDQPETVSKPDENNEDERGELPTTLSPDFFETEKDLTQNSKGSMCPSPHTKDSSRRNRFHMGSYTLPNEDLHQQRRSWKDTEVEKLSACETSFLKAFTNQKSEKARTPRDQLNTYAIDLSEGELCVDTEEMDVIKMFDVKSFGASFCRTNNNLSPQRLLLDSSTQNHYEIKEKEILLDEEEKVNGKIKSTVLGEKIKSNWEVYAYIKGEVSSDPRNTSSKLPTDVENTQTNAVSTESLKGKNGIYIISNRESTQVCETDCKIIDLTSDQSFC